MNRSSMLLVAVAVLAAAPAFADDLTGAKSLICSSIEVSACETSYGCDSGPASEWRVPGFLEIDLVTKQLRTTAASGENRQTTASVVTRGDGRIVLQGLENGRAFSIMIRESDGVLTAAVAREELTVSVFGVCTPVSR